MSYRRLSWHELASLRLAMQAALVALGSDTTLAVAAATQIKRKRERDKKRASNSRAALRDDPVAHAEYCERERQRNEKRRGSSGKRTPRWTTGEEVRCALLATFARWLTPVPRAGNSQEDRG